MVIGIIGGSGIADETDGGTLVEKETEGQMNSPHGSVYYLGGRLGEADVIFIPRHGLDHSLPPHLVPYKAIAWTFRSLGVTNVIGVSAVGAVNPAMHPGDLVVVDQLVDFTKRRDYTFYDGEYDNNDALEGSCNEGRGLGVVHIDMTDPYCPSIRSALTKAASEAMMGDDTASGTSPQGFHPRMRRSHLSGCYFATEGPRYETRAEIEVFRLLGADVVGMTGSPEAALCREAGICYALLVVVTNPAAGLSASLLDHEGVTLESKGARKAIGETLKRAMTNLMINPSCRCPASQYREVFDMHIMRGAQGGDNRGRQ
jgi:5'-methylthioadenosine phosphorylase